MRGDRIGLIGPNGAGKTTLLRLLLGELRTPERRGRECGGRRRRERADRLLRSAARAARSRAHRVRHGRRRQRHGDGQRPARVTCTATCATSCFRPSGRNAPVKALSGGERNRLLLARLFTRPANVLVLDEPTNDLDIETLELLEAQLVDWPGTLLLVSHDRAFLDNVVTSTLVFEGDGRVQEYVGGYEDWLRQRADAGRGSGVAPERNRIDAAPGNRPPTGRIRSDSPTAVATASPASAAVAQEALLQRAPRTRRTPRPHRSPRIRADAARSGNRRSRLLPKPGPNHYGHARETRNRPGHPDRSHGPLGHPRLPLLMTTPRPSVVIIAGPNGAGKSTSATADSSRRSRRPSNSSTPTTLPAGCRHSTSRAPRSPQAASCWRDCAIWRDSVSVSPLKRRYPAAPSPHG